ncbi:hypothetical protein [Streptomyces hokutonensis]|uniref:hypothetical protein n=1 Tax=Streptomyces hokutonensis TaxID=1306990 RepID=UPI003806BCD7
MDKPLDIGYACLHMHSAGPGEMKAPLRWADYVAHSPGDGLRWVYDVMRGRPQTSRGGFLESRGLFDFSESFHNAIRAIEADGWWSGAWLVLDDRYHFVFIAVPMLPIVPLDKAGGLSA